jgi:radical SAM protein with 4Fe4S-binding SPASM domain
MSIPIKSREYIEKKCVLTSVPRVLNIEVTNKCNLRCSICPNKEGDSFGFMDIGFLGKIIEENRDVLVGQAVFLHFGGEPLLHPDLPAIIKLLKKNGIRTMLSTNGTLLDDAISFDLMEAGLDYIVFSFDGYTRKTYEDIRRGANFDAVKRNILNFLKIKEENGFGITTQIQFVKTKTNAGEIDDFIEEWKKTNINHINIKSFCTRAGRVENIEEFSLRGRKDSMPSKRCPCFSLWETLIILWNGDVLACCQDLKNEFKLGNLREHTLTDLWNSPLLVEARRKQIKGDFSMSPCSRCDDWIYHRHPSSRLGFLCHSAVLKMKEKLSNQIIKNEGIHIIINHR